MLKEKLQAALITSTNGAKAVNAKAMGWSRANDTNANKDIGEAVKAWAKEVESLREAVRGHIAAVREGNEQAGSLNALYSAYKVVLAGLTIGTGVKLSTCPADIEAIMMKGTKRTKLEAAVFNEKGEEVKAAVYGDDVLSIGAFRAAIEQHIADRLIANVTMTGEQLAAIDEAKRAERKARNEAKKKAAAEKAAAEKKAAEEAEAAAKAEAEKAEREANNASLKAAKEAEAEAAAKKDKKKAEKAA